MKQRRISDAELDLFGLWVLLEYCLFVFIKFSRQEFVASCLEVAMIDLC